MLTAADEDGFSFDIVIPSIPGFGFSAIPDTPGMNPQYIADLFTKLMTEELGYSRFFAHGGDWGSSITEQIAINHADQLLGIHLTDIPFKHLFTIPADDLSEAEKQYLEKGKKWQQTEGGYAIIQSTKPQTAAYGLNDSPAGLAAWIIENFTPGVIMAEILKTVLQKMDCLPILLFIGLRKPSILPYVFIMKPCITHLPNPRKR